MSLRFKLLLMIILPAIIIYVATLSFINISGKRQTINTSRQLIDGETEHYAKIIESQLNEAIIPARTLAQTLSTFESISMESRRETVKAMLLQLMENNNQYSSLRCTWEPYSLDYLDSMYVYSLGSTSMGNADFKYKRFENRVIEEYSIEEDVNQLFQSDYYNTTKLTRKENILPLKFVENGDNESIERYIEYALPIFNGEQFVAALKIGINLDTFQIVIQNFQNNLITNKCIVSQNFDYLAHTNKKYIDQSLSEIYSADVKKYQLESTLKRGVPYSYYSRDSLGGTNYISYYPILLGNSNINWAFGTEVSIDVVLEEANNNYYIANLVSFIGAGLLFVLVTLLSGYITKPLRQMTKSFKDLANGDIDNVKLLKIQSKDEIGQTFQAVNQLIEGLKKTARFAYDIGQENFTTHFELLSSRDILGASLLDMRKNLIEIHEKNRQQEITEKRQKWATQGLAEFAEILRQNNDNIEEFTHGIIFYLVKYMEAAQGGFYIIQEENGTDFINLTTAYAYERRKYINGKFEIGEGLVGRCVQEQKTIFMTDIPKNYTRIKSALGDDAPKCLLIVPLTFNNETFGAMELASFKNIENFQIQFIEHIAESIASTLKTIKINLQTKKLLIESEEKSKELATKDEKMHETLEQMKIVQQELEIQMQEDALMKEKLSNEIDIITNQQFTYEKILDLLPAPAFLTDMSSKIMKCNLAFAKLVNRSKNSITGKVATELFPRKTADHFLLTDQIILKTKTQIDEELILPNSYGEKKLFKCVKTLIYNHKHAPTGIYSILWEIENAEVSV